MTLKVIVIPLDFESNESRLIFTYKFSLTRRDATGNRLAFSEAVFCRAKLQMVIIPFLMDSTILSASTGIEEHRMSQDALNGTPSLCPQTRRTRSHGS